MNVLLKWFRFLSAPESADGDLLIIGVLNTPPLGEGGYNGFIYNPFHKQYSLKQITRQLTAGRQNYVPGAVVAIDGKS